MQINDLKPTLLQHFDYAPPGHGQLISGEWFTPKTADSLAAILTHLLTQHESEQTLANQKAQRSAQEITCMEREILALEREMDALEERNEELLKAIEDLEKDEPTTPPGN